jgi:hypothetical protein
MGMVNTATWKLATRTAVAFSDRLSEEKETNQASTESSQRKSGGPHQPAGTEENKPSKDESSSHNIIAGIVGVVTPVAAEIARRAGIDRYEEAEIAEKLHAEEYARQKGGKAIHNTSSVYAPDGGVDKSIVTESTEKTMQVKHWDNEITEATLSQHSEVDTFASSNGFNLDPSNYEMEGWTYKDWSLRAKAKLQSIRIMKGSFRGLRWVENQISRIVWGIVGVSKWLLRKFASGVNLSSRVVVRSVRSSGSWYLGLSRGKQIFVGGAVIGIIIIVLYYLWKWYQGEDDSVPQTGSRGYREYSG